MLGAIATVGAVTGAVLGGVSSIVGSNAAKKNAEKQKELAKKKGELYDQLTESNLMQASENYKQTQAYNILGQSTSGIDLSSETFQKINQQVYGEYLKDVERINLQNEFYKLSVESEIAGINAQKPTTIQSSLNFLSSVTSGASSGMQFGSLFATPSSTNVGNYNPKSY